MQRDVDLSLTQRRAIARLLTWKPGRFVALPPLTTLEVIERPEPVAVPCGPPYALGLLPWQDQWLPTVDLQALLAGGEPAQERLRYALVVAWQSAPGAPIMHGALGLQALPETVTVDDSAACPLPQDDDVHWHGIAMACFSHAGRAVPILDTARLLEAAR